MHTNTNAHRIYSLLRNTINTSTNMQISLTKYKWWQLKDKKSCFLSNRDFICVRTHKFLCLWSLEWRQSWRWLWWFFTGNIFTNQTSVTVFSMISVGFPTQVFCVSFFETFQPRSQFSALSSSALANVCPWTPVIVIVKIHHHHHNHNRHRHRHRHRHHHNHNNYSGTWV